MSPILSAALIQAFLELTFYGVYFVIFSTVVYLFWHSPGLTKRPKILLFLALVVQFLAITAHWINTIQGTYLAFVKSGGGAEAERFYHTLKTPSLEIHIILTEMTNTLTDCLVVSSSACTSDFPRARPEIHRLYVIWGHKLTIIAFPLLMLIVQVGGAHSQKSEVPSRLTWFTASHYAWVIGWITTNLVASLVISGYSTGMISFKILSLSRMVQHSGLPLAEGRRMSGQRPLTSILVIMIESAALQTAMNLALLLALQLTAALGPNFILKGIQAVVLGMSTLLVHARIGLGWTKENPGASTAETNPSALRFTVHVTRTGNVEETELDHYRRDVVEAELAKDTRK
ncbi:hypothetical protein B0H16DRAFT_1769216 [Mycena metata]|uniref:Uncharacterized protein n=1 Tax=Mycena metata TaxID=1033252 RepID=A0AAD7JZ75_9AGAR|nr:hypothetical protein B0H16DRAFT_1769216 [Mycena metata]